MRLPVACALAAVGVSVITGCSSTTATQTRPGVPPASFYALPRTVAAKPPGTVLRALRLQSPDTIKVWVVLYHSRSRTGADVIVSGVVAIPSAPPPSGGYPLVSFAHGSTGFADSTAPSRTGDTGTPLALRDLFGMFPMRGYAFAATDYEGLGTPGPHPASVGLSAGHTVLDIARAARALGGAAVSRRLAVVGHSEGGHAALWAGQLALSYASDLQLRAVVASAPGANLPAIGRRRAATPQVTSEVLGLLGNWHEVYGEPLAPLLTRAGIAAATAIAADRPPTLGPARSLFRPGPFRSRRWNRLVRENTPGGQPIYVPVLMLVGTADANVPAATNLELAKLLRHSGDRVTLRILQGADHDHTLLDGRGAIAEMLARTLEQQGRHQ